MMKTRSRLVLLLLISLLPGAFKIAAYRGFFSARIGAGVKIGFGALLIFDELEIGNHCRISPFCLLRVKQLSLGQRTKIGMFTRVILYKMTLGPSVTVGPQVSILASDRDPRCEFTAGAETWIFEYCFINPARPIHLGRNVGVGGGSYIFAHGLWLSKLKGYPVSFGEVQIGDDVWLPWGCFIMPGIEVGSGSVVGARSLVTKNVPRGALVAGSPARIIREHVALEPELPEKIRILLEATTELCRFRSIPLTVESAGDWCVLGFQGRVEVAIATRLGASPLGGVHASVLHVVPDRLCDFRAHGVPAFSLESFQCTERSGFTSLQAEWLQHLRQIGTRHYPIDEVDVESAVNRESA